MKDLLKVTIAAVEDPAAVLAFGDPARVYQAGSLGTADIPARPERPFSLFKQLDSIPYPAVQETSRAARHDYLVYVYDDKGSYARIDRLLRLIRDACVAQVGQRAPSGVQCTGAEYFGTSADLVSQELDCFTKYVTIRFTASL